MILEEHFLAARERPWWDRTVLYVLSPPSLSFYHVCTEDVGEHLKLLTLTRKEAHFIVSVGQVECLLKIDRRKKKEIVIKNTHFTRPGRDGQGEFFFRQVKHFLSMFDTDTHTRSFLY